MNTFYWLLKREYWEHRGGFLKAPIIASAIFLTLNLMAVIGSEVFMRGKNIRFEPTDTILEQLQANAGELGAAANALSAWAMSIPGLVLVFVVFFYCLGALYDDRRDRSVLFWKSLPVRDRDTVLAKFVSAVVTAPMIAVLAGIACALALQLIILLWGSLHGVPLWSSGFWGAGFRISGTMLGTLPLHVVWALPALGWLLLVSAWARSKPFLWAVGLPIGAGVLFTWLRMLGMLRGVDEWFWTHIVARLFLGVIPWGWTIVPYATPDAQPLLRWGASGSLAAHWAQLADPQFWVGAAVGIAFLVAAIRIRERRSEI